MTSEFLESIDSEYQGEWNDGELIDSEASYDAEASPAEMRRRRRYQAQQATRRRALARGNQRVARLDGRRPAPPARAVVDAVKELDLQGQVMNDEVRARFAKLERDRQWTNLAAVTTALIPSVYENIGQPDSRILRSAIAASPLALLPGSDKKGIEGLLRHPAVYGATGLLGLALVGHLRQSGSAVGAIDIVAPSSIVVGDRDELVADVRDEKGRSVDNDVTWSSNKPEIISIDRMTGVFEAKARGSAIISATAGTVTRRARLDVVAAPVDGGGE
jgi:hypothetical protein